MPTWREANAAEREALVELRHAQRAYERNRRSARLREAYEAALGRLQRAQEAERGAVRAEAREHAAAERDERQRRQAVERAARPSQLGLFNPRGGHMRNPEHPVTVGAVQMAYRKGDRSWADTLASRVEPARERERAKRWIAGQDASRRRSGVGAWRSNPGLSLPRRILGVDSRLALAGAAVAGYVAFTRGGFAALANRQIGATSFTGSVASGGQWGLFGHRRPHAPATVNAATGMVYQGSRPNVPPAGAQGEGEWVVTACPDHSPGVCWTWEPLSTLAIIGVPPA